VMKWPIPQLTFIAPPFFNRSIYDNYEELMKKNEVFIKIQKFID